MIIAHLVGYIPRTKVAIRESGDGQRWRLSHGFVGGIGYSMLH